MGNKSLEDIFLKKENQKTSKVKPSLRQKERGI